MYLGGGMRCMSALVFLADTRFSWQVNAQQINRYFDGCSVILALLKAQVSLQLGKFFSSDNGVDISFYNVLIYVLNFTVAYSLKKLSDKLLPPYMYECFLNIEYLCICEKVIQIWALRKASFTLSYEMH